METSQYGSTTGVISKDSGHPKHGKHASWVWATITVITVHMIKTYCRCPAKILQVNFYNFKREAENCYNISQFSGWWLGTKKDWSILLISVKYFASYLLRSIDRSFSTYTIIHHKRTLKKKQSRNEECWVMPLPPPPKLYHWYLSKLVTVANLHHSVRLILRRMADVFQKWEMPILNWVLGLFFLGFPM